MTAPQDVAQTGASDVPWDSGVQGNPPEGSYRVTGVGPDVRSWGDGDKMREYRVTLRNHAGIEKQGVELSRFHDKPAPKVGDDIAGQIEDKGKHGLKLREAKQGGGGGGGGWKGGKGGSSDKSIEAQVCIKSGVELAVAAANGQQVDAAALTQNAVAAARALHAVLREMAG